MGLPPGYVPGCKVRYVRSLQPCSSLPSATKILISIVPRFLFSCGRERQRMHGLH
ncbi:unnamed protein product [Ixodes persulcatus]